MILRQHCGAAVVWLFVASLTLCVHSDVLGDSPVQHLDQIIDHWIYKTPGLIDNAVDVSDKENRFTVAKRVSQGWSIVIGSWKDMLSDWISNDRTLANLGGDYKVVYNYGFLFAYGIGFGFPLLLGLPSDSKDCGRHEFLRTLYEYELQNGVSGLLHRGSSASEISSLVTEFENVIGNKLFCLSGDENIESLKALNGVQNLISALRARISAEGVKRRKRSSPGRIVFSSKT